jgi:hypothetical protein
MIEIHPNGIDFHNDSWPKNESQTLKVTLLNASWGPYFTEIGDIITVATKSNLPLVSRRDGDLYLFVGASWLIDSQLLVEPDFENDPGFSDIMRGSVCNEIGKTCHVEEFHIHQVVWKYLVCLCPNQ